MKFKELHDRIISDLNRLGIDTKGFDLILKPFSKTYLGRYYTVQKRIVVYVYRNSARSELFSYGELFRTILHEVAHHLQYCDPEYVRVKGVMHNAGFYKLYNKLVIKWDKVVMINVLSHNKNL